MKYKWILFDADETLFHFDAFTGLQRMFARVKVNFTADDYQQYQALNKSLWDTYQDGHITASQLKDARFSAWANKLGVSTQQLNNDFLTAMAEICTLLPGAEHLIKQLVGKVNLGIITNGFTDLQTIRLENVGFTGIFSPLVISEEVGVAKPARAIFEYALRQMDHPQRQQVLMVGDNPYSDIQGGLNAGFDTCWLNRHAQLAPEGIKPHYEVNSLAALSDLLFNG
ncbi:pyrimidine 5'-nucleotidase [Shewanella sp.]|nr:pyrimidine 5'-nucleotidase [Shewanella sp.]